MDAPLHILRPSGPRRTLGLVMQGLLGAMLLWLAVAYPPESLALRLFLVAFGIVALMLAQRGWQGSQQGIVLREDGLFQEDGRPIAPLAEIASVDRALFTFKPSNGFLIRLAEPIGRAWVPGMWWRVGRRVGIGGVTGGAETKMLADTLSALVARRDAEAGR